MLIATWSWTWWDLKVLLSCSTCSSYSWNYPKTDPTLCRSCAQNKPALVHFSPSESSKYVLWKVIISLQVLHEQSAHRYIMAWLRSKFQNISMDREIWPRGPIWPLSPCLPPVPTLPPPPPHCWPLATRLPWRTREMNVKCVEGCFFFVCFLFFFSFFLMLFINSLYSNQEVQLHYHFILV